MGPTSDKRWHAQVFITGRSPHPTRFCGFVLGPATDSMKTNEFYSVNNLDGMMTKHDFDALCGYHDFDELCGYSSAV